jgi:hypothetical protein
VAGPRPASVDAICRPGQEVVCEDEAPRVTESLRARADVGRGCTLAVRTRPRRRRPPPRRARADEIPHQPVTALPVSRGSERLARRAPGRPPVSGARHCPPRRRNGRAYARPLRATLGQWLIQPTQWAHTVHVASSWAEKPVQVIVGLAAGDLDSAVARVTPVRPPWDRCGHVRAPSASAGTPSTAGARHRLPRAANVSRQRAAEATSRTQRYVMREPPHSLSRRGALPALRRHRRHAALGADEASNAPISRRRPPVPGRTTSDSRRRSRSRSPIVSASCARSPPRQSTTINARSLKPCPIVAGLPHHRRDVLHGRRVRGIEPPLVARRATGVATRQRRRRAPPTGGIENW